MMKKKKAGRVLLSFLLSLAMVIGFMPGMSMTAHAEPTEELLTTITGTGTNGAATSENISYSTGGVATLTFSGEVLYASAWGWWGYNITLTVTPADGYTITKCVFYDNKDNKATDSEAPFVAETSGDQKMPKVNGSYIYSYSDSTAVKKIEVYGYATPTTVDVTGVSLNKTTTTLTVGGTVSFTATVEPNDATDKYVTWSSDSDALKLYADSSCTVALGTTTGVAAGLPIYAKGISLGGATVTATSRSNNDVTASCAVTVNAAQTQTETLLTTIYAMGIEQTHYTTENVATVSFEGTSKYIGGWTASPIGSITVNAAEGYTITKCVFHNQSGDFTDENAPFTMEYSSWSPVTTSIDVYGYAPTVAVTGVSLNKNTATLTVGGTVSFTATVEPNDATDKYVTWSSNSDALKLYADSSCTVALGTTTGVAAGKPIYAKGISLGGATVTATSRSNNDVTASCNVTVNAAVSDSPYANLVGTTTTVTFNEMPWYIIADNSTAMDAGTVTLLAANDSFGISAFKADYSSNSYNNSDVKAYLDRIVAGTAGEGKPDFKNVADTIKPVTLTTYAYNSTTVVAEETTDAKLYLLSTSEAETYANLISAGYWWLRSPGNNNNDFVQAAVVAGGNISINGAHVEGNYDVRPALQLDLSKVTFDSKTNTFSVGSSTVTPATIKTAPTAKTLTYNGQAQKLVTAGTAEGGTMQYALGTATEATEPYTTSIPAKTDAGTYYVWYRLDSIYGEFLAGGSVMVTIGSEGGESGNNEVEVEVKAPDPGKAVSTAESGVGTTGFGVDIEEQAATETIKYVDEYGVTKEQVLPAGDKLKLTIVPEGAETIDNHPSVSGNNGLKSTITGLYSNAADIRVDVLDIVLTWIKGAVSKTVKETTSLFEAVVPYDSSKNDITVVREHDGVSAPLDELSANEAPREGSFRRTANSVNIYSSKFSTYVIAYSVTPGNKINNNPGPAAPAGGYTGYTKVEETPAASNGASAAPVRVPKTIPVYRLYNTKTGEHFYTINEAEKKGLAEERAAEGWVYEGVAWNTSDMGTIPVYRVFDANRTGQHRFTISAAERDKYLADGWKDEGIAWLSEGKEGKKVYKLTNPNMKMNMYLYTTNPEERDVLVALGYKSEEADFTVK